MTSWAASRLRREADLPADGAKDSWFVAHSNHAFPFYNYAAFCVVLVIVMALWVPETKGKSLEEIERGWTKA